MVQIPFGRGAYERTYAGEPEVRMLNRFFEQNPTNLREQQALLARPGTTLLTAVGSGAIRGLNSQVGAFDSDLFITVGTALYRYRRVAKTLQLITGTIRGTEEPKVTFVKGAAYQHMFISDGTILQVYTGGVKATGTLTLTPSSPPDIDSEVIEIGGTYYGWSASVNAGSPDGTMGNPFLALLGSDDADSLSNMASLLNFDGTLGTTYSNTVPGPSSAVTAGTPTATTIPVTAKSEYTDGNSVTTTVTAGQLAWGSGTLTGGGAHALTQVLTPDGVAIASLATLASHVIAVHGNSQRFNWILPGATTIDALNFAEAESEPDEVVQALTVGDSVWLIGKSTTEAWYATGDAAAPFAPNKGRTFRRGVFEATAVKVKDNVYLVGDDGVVYRIGQGIERVSNNGIEERIRVQQRRAQGL